MFAKVRRHRDSTSSPSASAAATPVSPLAQDFDFGLNSPVSASSSDPFRPSADSLRQRPGDRPASSRKSIVSLQPPVLPPIPRVASANRHDRGEKAISQHQPGQEMGGKARERESSVETESTSRQSALGEGWDFNPSFDWQDNYSADTSGASSARDQSQKSSNHAPSQSLLDLNFDSPRMEASMFPKQDVQAPATTAAASPAMSRSFVDSRDKPYSQPAQRPPPIQSSYSSPDMLSPRSPATFQSNASGRSPLSPYSATSGGTRLSPHTATRPNDLRRPVSGVASTSYSGSTARPSTQSSASTAASPLQHQTIGTPYQETSPSFPAPQHVATRPKTVGSSSTIAGVMVPTHHTSGQAHERPKSERRKTRLLNPMALLQRRRSGQDTAPVPDEEELRLRAQAQARQKRVATVGVNSMPEDFDPRIRGKVVHDFSAPRPQRNYSYSDAERRPSEQLQSSNSAPFISLPPEDPEPPQSTQHSQQPSDPSSRHSRHAPIFVEHLAEDPDPTRPMSSVQAETLENRDFLNRASHHSAFSQDSSTLPPFARRSQHMDPMQASFFRDDESKRSSDPSSSNERNSGGSSAGFISPLVVRQQNAAPDPRESSSPVSPQSLDKGQRPVSDMSAFTHMGSGMQSVSPIPDLRPQRDDNVVRQATQPVVNSPGEGQSPKSPQQQTGQLDPSTSPNRMSREAPGTLSLPQFDSPANPSPLSSPRFDSSTASTPEAATFGTAVAVRSSLNASPPKIVEKRASAVGHSKRLSNIPKHRVSNASRFSFQMGESAAEERVLEEKHRRMAAAQPRKADVPDEDDEDYFDEDAMDDEDEMEVMERSQPGLAPNLGMVGQGPGGYLQPPTRDYGQESDDGSVYDEEVPEIQTERSGDYVMHPAFRGVDYDSHRPTSQHNLQGGNGVQQFMDETNERQHQRYFSDASVLSSNPGDFVQPSGGFYMQPQAAGYSPHATPLENTHAASTGFIGSSSPFNSPDKNGPQQPRDDFGSPTSNNSGGTAPSRDSASTNHSTASGPREPRTAATTVSPEPVKEAPMGLGVSGFSDFVFTDGPDLSLGNSPATSPQNLSRPATAGNRSTADSTTLPHNGKWMALSDPSAVHQPAQRGTWDELPRSPGFSHAGPGSQSAGFAPNRVSMADQNAQYAAPSASSYSESDYGAQDDGDDDMYFDDGGFDAPTDHGPGLNEDELDRPDFAGGFRGMEPRFTAQHHQRDPSAMTITSLSSDGPYPTFAIPNQFKQRQRQRDSRLLLEDLPLQTNVDPEWIPQRNPSEDAKRLGLSSRVPPLPAQPGGGFEALERMQASLQSYHAALADAAMKAAGEGRFVRQPSLSTVGSGSPDLARGGDGGSVYSQEGGRDQGEGEEAKEQTQEVQREVPPAPQHGAGANMSSPSKAAFDFGFHDPNGRASMDDYASNNNDYPSYEYPADDSYMHDDYAFDFNDADLADDDVIAAANASALANDDDGFYGTEFGFYAKGRPSTATSQTSQTESINGGYFGDAGEDPFSLRNKALQEPNLTPITERSEFSTRNSMVHFGPPSAGPWSGGGLASPGLARLPISPLADGDGGLALEQLRKARAGAFGGSNPSSPAVQRFSNGGYFGAFPVPGAVGTPGHYATDSPVSRDSPASARGAQQHPPWMESAPTSASSAGKGLPFSAQHGSADVDATPGKGAPAPLHDPETARKAPAPGAKRGHEREGSDSVTYVQERDPSSPERPRWVLERRRTGELGTEVVGREVVKGGWI